VTIEVFDADLLVPPALHDTGDANRVVAITLVDLHLQSCLGVSGIDADDGQSQLMQLSPEPRRRRSCLKPNPRNMRRMRFDECRDRFRVGRNHAFALDLSRSINNADRCQLQRYVQSDIVSIAALHDCTAP
jgi:hypothetical protein